jgi:hypothetical protein
MAKFLSLLQFRQYVENLPLNQIVIDLVTKSRDSEYVQEWFERDSDKYGTPTTELVGKLAFKVDFHVNHQNMIKEELLYCYYFHDVDDIWVVPFTFSAIFKVQVNSLSARKPLFYTPPVPIVSFSYPDTLYQDLKQGRAGIIPIFRRDGDKIKAIRLIFANEMLNNFEVLIEDNNEYGIVGAGRSSYSESVTWDDDGQLREWVQERFYKTFRNQFMSRYSLLRTPFLILVPTNALSLNYPQGDFIVI